MGRSLAICLRVRASSKTLPTVCLVTVIRNFLERRGNCIAAATEAALATPRHRRDRDSEIKQESGSPRQFPQSDARILKSHPIGPPLNEAGVDQTRYPYDHLLGAVACQLRRL